MSSEGEVGGVGILGWLGIKHLKLPLQDAEWWKQKYFKFQEKTYDVQFTTLS